MNGVALRRVAIAPRCFAFCKGVPEVARSSSCRLRYEFAIRGEKGRTERREKKGRKQRNRILRWNREEKLARERERRSACPLTTRDAEEARDAWYTSCMLNCIILLYAYIHTSVILCGSVELFFAS